MGSAEPALRGGSPRSFVAAAAAAALWVVGALALFAYALLPGGRCSARPQPAQQQQQLHYHQQHQQQQQQQQGIPWEPLAAYFQVFSRPTAVRAALASFRAAYPTARVLVVNDGGDPALAGVVAPFNVTYRYARRITSTGRAGGFHVSQGCNSTAACGEFVGRLVEAAAGADYLLLLEEDVRVLKPINLTQLRYDINQGGHVGGDFTRDYLAAITRLRGFRRKEPPKWRGAGGSVFRAAFLRAVAASPRWSEAWLPPLLALHDGMLPVDKLLTSLLYIVGGTHGSWRGYAWIGYWDDHVRVFQGGVEVVHGNKSLNAVD